MTYILSSVPPWAYRWAAVAFVLAVPSICRAGHEACEAAAGIVARVLGGE